MPVMLVTFSNGTPAVSLSTGVVIGVALANVLVGIFMTRRLLLRGTTIAEFGAGNRVLDMIVYRRVRWKGVAIRGSNDPMVGRVSVASTCSEVGWHFTAMTARSLAASA